MFRAIFGFMALIGWAGLAQAGPADNSIYGTPAEARWAPFHANMANVPGCDDQGVLSTITSRFSEAENIYWGGTYAIGGFEDVRDIGFRSNGIDYIPRRYCIGRALLDDPRAPTPHERRPRTVIYNVTANLGIIGVSWGVEWCVLGLDREHAYAPDCYVLRPIIERRIGELKQVNWVGEYGLKARY